MIDKKYSKNFKALPAKENENFEIKPFLSNDDLS